MQFMYPKGLCEMCAMYPKGLCEMCALNPKVWYKACAINLIDLSFKALFKASSRCLETDTQAKI